MYTIFLTARRNSR